MLFPEDIETRLGFDTLRQRLAALCLSEAGRRAVRQMRFSGSPDELEPLLRQTDDLLRWLVRGDHFPLLAFADAEPWWELLAVHDSFLELENIFQIGQALRVAHDLQAAIAQQRAGFPDLYQLAQPVAIPVALMATLNRHFDENGNLSDTATPALARVRKRLREEETQLRRLMERLFRNAAAEGWIPEGMSATVRDGRLVLPLLAEHKRRIRGVVVDESGTGQTVYVEPLEALEANNEIRDLQLEERREIIRILRELTAHLRTHQTELKQVFAFLAAADFTHAKARLARELEATLPVLQHTPVFDWRGARHPLLWLNLRGKRQVVPLNLKLTGEDRFLVVSGPNAGGKSVCLKTVGLIQYMLQCGLLVPVEAHSRMGLFQKMLVDIGDQQSIENDLSTYSSHLRNMKRFIEQADAQTLVLLDELGSGTDPNFGGGIAQAVLGALVAKSCRGVATTHYHNLKVMAGNTPGLVNGAMLFDTEKLQPLYILETGRPGSSFALEIAHQTGFPEEVLREAERVIGAEVAGLEKLMKKAADDQQRVARQARELAEREKVINELQARYQKLLAELEARKKEIIDRAKSEAAGLLKETNREIEKTIRHIKENKAEKKETKKVRDALKDLTQKVAAQPDTEKAALKAGDKVRIRGQEVTGTLLEINGRQAVVRFGEIRTVTKLDQLVRSDQAADDPAVRKARPAGLDLRQKQAMFSATLDVRGKRVEEALPEINRFLDDALLLGHSELRILHGKGEGVLRKVVREALKQNRNVASAADEHIERGGDGITVVVLK
jgi:DNA mismatch repair protein MutS2